MTDSFRDRLERHMAEKGCNARRLALDLGISPQTVSNWLRGGGIEDDKAQLLGRYFEIDWYELKYGEPYQGGGDTETLNNEERLLLAGFRSLNGRGKRVVLGMIKVLRDVEGEAESAGVSVSE